MHPQGGAIGKHMAVGIQGKVSCQTTDLDSATHPEGVFKGTQLTLKCVSSMFREGKLIADLCQRETSTLGVSGKIALKSQVSDQETHQKRDSKIISV